MDDDDEWPEAFWFDGDGDVQVGRCHRSQLDDASATSVAVQDAVGHDMGDVRREDVMHEHPDSESPAISLALASIPPDPVSHLQSLTSQWVSDAPR